MSEFPYSCGFVKIVFNNLSHIFPETFMFINPGPATDTPVISGISLIYGHTKSAISRGFFFNSFDKTIATFVEKSPKSRFLGTSTTILFQLFDPKTVCNSGTVCNLSFIFSEINL